MPLIIALIRLTSLDIQYYFVEGYLKSQTRRLHPPMLNIHSCEMLVVGDVQKISIWRTQLNYSVNDKGIQGAIHPSIHELPIHTNYKPRNLVQADLVKSL